jgi:hypothetical protein
MKLDRETELLAQDICEGVACEGKRTETLKKIGGAKAPLFSVDQHEHSTDEDVSKRILG